MSGPRPGQPAVEAGPAPKGLGSRQTATVALLFLGYAAYYFCRSDLSVAMPLLIDHLHQQGVPRAAALTRLGTIASLGVLAYALGKLFLTGLGDLWGGRRSFTTGLGGAVAFTLLFASAGTLPVFTLAWVGNRLTQSIGWAGLIKVSSRWFRYSSYGTVAGILSLSFLVGDAAARASMGVLIDWGYSWRLLFLFAAAVAGLMLVANLLFLRESRVEAGYPEAEPNPLNLFAGSDSPPRTLRELLTPLLRSRAFISVCLLSLGLTLVRETFNTWTPVYFRDFVGYGAGRAASMSAIFPAVGAVSVLLAGWWSDRLGVTGRSLIMFMSLAAAAALLAALGAVPAGASTSIVPPVLVGAEAFCLLGPYSYLAGAFALDFGGKQASAVSSGVIDGVGYLGGVFAGDTVARFSVTHGWPGVFRAMACVSLLSALAAGYLHLHQRRLAPLRAGSVA
jgi:OPA family glycerol-3-phosphate transporter-like MFS transporter